MSRFLIYLSPRVIQRAYVLDDIISHLDQIGTTLLADENLIVAETEESSSRVFGIVNSLAPSEGSFFVADSANVGYRGDDQFAHALNVLTNT